MTVYWCQQLCFNIYKGENMNRRRNIFTGALFGRARTAAATSSCVTCLKLETAQSVEIPGAEVVATF